jgi:hypothetical protein
MLVGLFALAATVAVVSAEVATDLAPRSGKRTRVTRIRTAGGIDPSSAVAAMGDAGLSVTVTSSWTQGFDYRYQDDWAIPMQPARQNPVCKGGPSRPFTVKEVLSALRRAHVESIYSAKTDILCRGDIVAYVTNYRTIANSVGLIGCAVRKATIYDGVEKLKTKGRASDGKVRYYLENVDCSVYPHGAPGLKQARRVRKAFLDLQTKRR